MMSNQKSNLTQLLVIIALLGCVYSQRITVPLQAGKDQFYISIKQGPNQCEVKVIPSINFCSNIITQSVEEISECGSTFVTDYSFYDGNKDYAAPFQIGNSQTSLEFSVPSGPSSRYYGINLLNFGVLGFENQKNTLVELFEAGQISEKRVYFSLNDSSTSKSENSIAGQMDIGQPDLSLIKKGSKFVEIKTNSGESYYTANSDRNIKFFGQTLDSRSVVGIELDTPFHAFTFSAFDSILKIFTQQGIEYTRVGSFENSKVQLKSIEKLQDIEVPLLVKDGSRFIIKIKPSQYTRPTVDGNFELLIKCLSYTGSISLGNTIFESYYIGFDLPTSGVLIAEKAGQQLHNFRGYSQQE